VEAKRAVVEHDEYPTFPRIGENVVTGDFSHPNNVRNSVQCMCTQRRFLWRRRLIGTSRCTVAVREEWVYTRYIQYIQVQYIE
jgi:hypothetical protein